MSYEMGIVICFIFTIIYQWDFYKAVDTKDIPEILKTGATFMLAGIATLSLILVKVVDFYFS